MAAGPTVIEMSAREVVAAGEPFRAWSEVFHDPGVALDTVLSLGPVSEPIVLRVKVSGDADDGSSSLRGDWLYLVGDDSPVKIARPSWQYDAASQRWSAAREWIDAWEQNHDPRWSLHAAYDVGVYSRVGNELVALAACGCARDLILESSLVSFDAAPIREIESWCGGGSSSRRVRAVALRSSRSSRIYAEANELASVGAHHYASSWSPDDETRPGREEIDDYYAVRFSLAVYGQLESGFGGSGAGRRADIVRGMIPTVLVLTAAATDDPGDE